MELFYIFLTCNYFTCNYFTCNYFTCNYFTCYYFTCYYFTCYYFTCYYFTCYYFTCYYFTCYYFTCYYFTCYYFKCIILHVIIAVFTLGPVRLATDVQDYWTRVSWGLLFTRNVAASALRSHLPFLQRARVVWTRAQQLGTVS